MPKVPRGEKRPANVIGAAVKVMRIATGEEEEDIDQPEPGKNQAAAELGRKGGTARAAQERLARVRGRKRTVLPVAARGAATTQSP